eukprot:TRINITY_DN64039_c0_g1_i1.p1 TRINITY_DN64039_c0_g1~~TRINITY_DN64039_c0_g1_i1.p1  ORF type:complete len:305 (-),score=24.53 TRINITY_DN64039_c0_g1_i1:59-973(-)
MYRGVPSNPSWPVFPVRLQYAILLGVSTSIVQAVFFPQTLLTEDSSDDAASPVSWIESTSEECVRSAAVVPKPRLGKGRYAPCADVLQERFKEAARHNCGGRCDVVLIGASIIEHAAVGSGCDDFGTPKENKRFERSHAVFQEDVEQALISAGYNAPLVFAASSEHTQNMLWRLPDLLPLAYDPSVFAIQIGGNNIRAGQTPADVSCGIKDIIRLIHEAHPTSNVLVQAVYPRFDLEGTLLNAIQETNRLVFEVVEAADVSWLHYLDCTHIVTEDLLADNVHPSPELYKMLWSPCVMPAVFNLL